MHRGAIHIHIGFHFFYTRFPLSLHVHGRTYEYMCVPCGLLSCFINRNHISN